MTIHKEPPRLNRFGEPSVLILISLAGGPKHGYAIILDIEDKTNMKLGPGTLYGAITKLCDYGLIEPLDSDDRRRPYQITNTGKTALTEHLERWQAITITGLERLKDA